MPRPTKYVTRSALGWGSSPAAYANPRSGLVIHYDSSNQNLANKNHSACLSYWRATRSFHTGPSRGWADIGYSFMACAHGYVLEGRGLYKQQAAQPGGNSTHYSVTLATGPNDTITTDQINAVRQLRQWLMEPDTSISGKVLGHRDFIATSCPGDKAYAMVKDGTFTKAPGAITDSEGYMIGLKEGDKGEGVVAVQRFIDHCGFGDHLGKAGVDGHWGPATSKGLLALRKSLGSSATVANSVTGTAYQQMQRALAKREAEKLIEWYGLDDLPSGGGGPVDAKDLVGKTVTSKITEVK